MDIEDLFVEVNVLSTREVAAAFGVSEAETRECADELGVRKIGASFVWSREDVEELIDLLETDDAEGDDGSDSSIDPEVDEESAEDGDEDESEEPDEGE